MKTTRSRPISVSKEMAMAVGTGTLALSMLTSCDTPKPASQEVFQTMTPDINKLNTQRERAIDFIGGGENAKYIGEQMASFQVQFPEQPEAGKPASTVSGTIFEIKSTLPENLPLTLALYVPENGDKPPVPVVINHLTSDGSSLGEGQVPDANGVPVTRYGIAAMPLDEQYFGQIVNGGLTLTPGSFDRYLKTNDQGELVPLYTVWFKDITPNNVAGFMHELSQEKDITKVQAKIMERVYGVTFNDSQYGRSLTLELGNGGESNEMVSFLEEVFFGSDMVAHAAGLDDFPTNTPTPEATATTPAPAINESVKTAIGEEEYNEILTGEVKGKDYITGKDSNWTVETSSVKATEYNDSVFSHVVTGEATDANGKKFTVIWNEEGNYWFKSENINTDLNATERTDFGEQLQGMVENRDLYRMLLTQIDTTFPENTETARFWMVPRAASIPMNEFFYQLDMSRADFSDDILTQNKDKETYMDIRRGTFTKGNEPYKYAAMIDGIATDLKNSQGESIADREFSVIPMIVQNSDGKSMIWFGGLDAVQRDDILFSSNSVDSFGNNGIQRFFINQWNRMSLVVPPADEAYWNNYGKAGGNNGGIHFRGDVNFANDAIIAMQGEPGTFFSLLSESMQQRLDDNLTEIKNNGWGVSKAVPFEGNGLPQNVIDYLSNHIFETYYNDYGSK